MYFPCNSALIQKSLPNKSGFCLGLVAYRLLILGLVPGPKQERNNTTKIHDAGEKYFLLGVTVTFSSDEVKMRFLNAFAPYATYVRENEPTTLSYEIFESDKDSKRVFIFERYVNKDAYINIHRSSESFLKFRSNLTAMTEKGDAVIEGHSYLESGIGYI